MIDDKRFFYMLSTEVLCVSIKPSTCSQRSLLHLSSNYRPVLREAFGSALLMVGQSSSDDLLTLVRPFGIIRRTMAMSLSDYPFAPYAYLPLFSCENFLHPLA